MNSSVWNNRWFGVNNDYFGHQWGDLLMNFMSGTFTSENYEQITSRVTEKSLFMGSQFSYALLMPLTLDKTSHGPFILPMLFVGETPIAGIVTFNNKKTVQLTAYISQGAFV